MTSSTRIIVDEDEPEVDPTTPPFSPRPDIKPRKDRNFTDEFVVVDFLGRGKFGEVKRCRELATGREFAAKFIATPRPQDKTDVECEISTMRRLHHRRIVQLYEAFETKKEMCLILEIVYGGELFDRVITEDFLLTEKACVCIVRQICEGVQFIHSHNIIHLDMKPENILCLSKSSNRIKIIDFGLARDYNPRTDTRVLFGTPEFMAPEVIQYDPIDFSTDMWSVGVICYVLLSGLSPFLGDNDHETLGNVIKGRYGFEFPEFADVSLDARDMISKLLVTDKKKRSSASQCLEHPWLKVSSTPQTPTLDLSKIQLKHFVYKRKWQKAVNALIALRRIRVNLRTNQQNASSLSQLAAEDAKASPTPPTAYRPQNDGGSSCNRSRNFADTPKISNVAQPMPSKSLSPSVPSCLTSKSPPASSIVPASIVASVPLPEPKSSSTSQVGKPSASNAAVTGDAIIEQSTLNRRTCHKASDAPETFGNGHVFNLSKMIQMNRASRQLEEHSPVEIWQRDSRIAGSSGTLARRQQQFQQPIPHQSKNTLNKSKVAVDNSPSVAATNTFATMPTASRMSSTNQRIRCEHFSAPDESNVPSNSSAPSNNVECVWNVSTTLAAANSNGNRSTQQPVLHASSGSAVRNHVPAPSVPARRQPPPPPTTAATRLSYGSFTKTSSSPTTTATSTAPSAMVWSKQNSVETVASRPPKVTAGLITAQTMTAPTTTVSASKDIAMIKDRVRFFNKNDSVTTVASSTPKSTSWFKRNGLFK